MHLINVPNGDPIPQDAFSRLWAIPINLNCRP
jgi:hypothetical protein